MEKISDILRTLMTKKKISVTELANGTGLSRQSIYTLLSKTTNQADINNLRKIADCLGEDLNVFCGLKDYVKPVEMTDDERVLLAVYRRFNAAGQQKISEYAMDMSDNRRLLK